MDIGAALTYVTKDEAWLKKVLVGGLLLLIPLIGGLIMYGFGVRIVRNVLAGEPNPLPEWDDIGGDLSRGFFVWLGTIIWSIPIYVLYGCTFALSASSDAGSILSLFLNFCVILPLSLLLGAFVSPTIIGRFAVTDDFKSMIQFNEVLATIRGIGIGPYVMYFVLILIASIVASLGIIACFIGVIFTLAYAIFAMSHGIGQLARLAPGSVAATAAAPNHPAF